VIINEQILLGALSIANLKNSTLSFYFSPTLWFQNILLRF